MAAQVHAPALINACSTCGVNVEPMESAQQLADTDFDVSRTFAMLTAVLVLPMYLALSVVSYSLGAII